MIQKLRLLRCLTLFTTFCFFLFDASAQKVGESLPAWKEGEMEIHHINTGRGNATFFLLPDGTTLLIDAGALDPTDPRTQSARNTKAAPNDQKQPGEWIARYIRKVMANAQLEPVLNYAQITHFHDDHMGMPFDKSAKAASGDYFLTGITEVAEYIPVQKIIDRGYPDYAYPQPQNDKVMKNYKRFVDWKSKNGITFEQSKPGHNDQITLKRNSAPYTQIFEIRNVIANGELWTGLGTNTRSLFPELKSLKAGQYPSENMCSIGVRLSYGKFDYFSGGDMPGVLQFGAPFWNDVETPVSKIVGPVEAQILDHHGNRDSQNESLLGALRPRTIIIPTWSSDHPGHDVLARIYNQQIYAGDRDVFATDMLEANKLVIGEMLDLLKSSKGHIVIKVAKGGDSYQVVILDDSNEDLRVKKVFSGYQSR